MGGRRARSFSEVVGSGVARQVTNLENAIAAQDPEAVAVSSAKLMASSKRIASIVYYASKLASFIQRIVESGKELSYSERESLARKEWSKIKRKEKLKDDPIVTQAVIRAAAKAIAKGED